MNYRNNFTSNIYKLIFNSDRIEEIKKGKFRPISMHFALTDKCNLNCSFCSNEKRMRNEFEFGEVQNVLNTFHTLGCKSVEFTGGEPTQHPFINDIITYAKNLDYSIGIKSNGLNIRSILSEQTILNLDWLRISLNSLDSIDINKLDFYGLSNLTTFGFSYVVHDNTDHNIFDKIHELKCRYNAKYVRIIPDNAFNSVKIAKVKETVMTHSLMKEHNVFWHDKNYELPNKCYIPWLKPFINTDKYIYYCCATQMFERKFIPKYRLCSIDTQDIINTWLNVKPIKGSVCKGGICYFKNHNELIEILLDGCEHSDFI